MPDTFSCIEDTPLLQIHLLHEVFAYFRFLQNRFLFVVLLILALFAVALLYLTYDTASKTDETPEETAGCKDKASMPHKNHEKKVEQKPVVKKRQAAFEPTPLPYSPFQF